MQVGTSSVTSEMTRRTSGRLTQVLNRFLMAAVIFAALGTFASAQNAYDSGTPAESKAGQSSAASYAPDKLETVNLTNGNLSMMIPLASVGGRGSAGYTVALSYNSKVWSAQHTVEAGFTGQGATSYPPLDHFAATYDDPAMKAPNVLALGGGWTIAYGAAVRTQLMEMDPAPTTLCSDNLDGAPFCGYLYVLTKAWLRLPDGSEVELRDAATGGAPARTASDQGYHDSIDRDRGRVWQSTDGSNITFITDANNGVVAGPLSGWVFFADGTRMRMEGGVYAGEAAMTEIIDRQGNYVTVTPGSQGMVYTDELGRQVVLQSTASGATITIKGYGGVPDRVITIDAAVLGALDTGGVATHLRSDFRSLPRPFTTGDFQHTRDGDWDHTLPVGQHTDLFLKSEGNENVDDRTVVTGLNLPDGHKLTFRYNQYGEVAEVVYPGGGISQIDYRSGASAMCEAGNAQFRDTLNRSVSERRLLNDGANLDATWTYGVGTGVVDGANSSYTLVEAHQGGATGTLLTSEKHYFLAINAEYRRCTPIRSTGTNDEKWQNAKEYRTETQTGTGTLITKRVWQQRATPGWANDVGLSYNAYAAQHGMESDISNDPRVMSEDTILENGKMKRVEYGYDDFNNVTSIKEYDFGGTDGSLGALLKQTIRTYATSLNGYCYTNLSGTDGSCGTALAADVSTIIHQRRLLLNQTVKDGAGNQEAYSELEYDNYNADGNHAALVVNSGMVGYDGARFAYFSSSAQPRGNVTKTSAWAGGSSYVTSYARYDNAGNVVSTKDARGIESFVSYADQFADGVGRGTYAFPTSNTSAVPDPTNQRGTNTPLTSSNVYEFATGQARSTTDANGKTTSFQYNDPLSRITRVDRSDGGWTTYIYATGTSAGQPSDYVLTRTALDGARYIDSYQFFDMMGRPSRAFLKVDSSSTPYVTTDTQYDALGRVLRASNPYLTVDSTSAINPSGRWTTNAYDLAGRVTTVTTPDGAVVTTAYSGNQVTVTDQAGKARRSVSDGLGRLTQVVEDPAGLAYATNYYYDARGNLRKVDQGGQLRFFMYDSLGRLIRAKNPEQTGNISADSDFPSLTDATSGTSNGNWSMGYTYDADGNLYKRKDARNTVTTYTYDNLNRAIRTDYSDGTPYTLNTYDFATNGRGRYNSDYESSLTGTINSVSAYDAMGRPTTRSTTFYVNGSGWTTGYNGSRSYDLAGDVLTQTYPSGRTVTNTYDAAGRLSSFTGNLGDGTQRTYSSGVAYDEASRLQQEQFGTATPLYHKLHYNVRGQLYDVRLGTASWQADEWGADRGALINYYATADYSASSHAARAQSGPDNNGNLRGAETYTLDQAGNWAVQAQSYTYDTLNRLTAVNESQITQSGTVPQFQQVYTYDRWGNRTINAPGTTAGINSKQFDTNDLACTNRLYAPGDTTSQCTPKPESQRQMRYDEAGNLNYDAYTGTGARTYDAENRMTMAWGGDAVSGTYQNFYVYDAAGHRMRRTAHSVETRQVYGFDGELVAEYAGGAVPASPQKEYGYRGGELLVTAEPSSSSTSQGAQSATWQNAVGVSASTGSLTKTAAAGWNTAGATSSQSLQSGDGYVEFTAALSTDDVLCGLSHGDTNQDYSDIDFAIYASHANSNTVYVLEGGVNKGSFGTLAAGDKFRVAVEGGVVKYYRVASNGALTLFYTSAVAPSYPLLADTSLYWTGDQISNVVMGASGGGSWQLSGFVTSFYTSILNRQPSSTELSSQVATLTTAMGQGQTAFFNAASTLGQNLFLSQEYTNRGRTDHQFVEDLYVAFCGREPDASGWAAWEAGVPSQGRPANVYGFSSSGNGEWVSRSNAQYAAAVAAQSQGSGGGVNWLISDHLGTPRMVVDQTGSLAGIKRHDYLPFGEEISAGAGGRNQTQGYVGNDNVRQHFTSKERDVETGLDYFGVRYFANTQGRFTSPDPFSIILLRQSSPNDEKTRAAFSQFINDPRRWNRFAYAVNSPLVFTDKTGLDIMIIENHSTGVFSNPAGHTAIAITGRGVYSMGNAQGEKKSDNKNNILGGSVKDYIWREASRRDTTLIIIKTTPEQDAAAASKLEDIAASRSMLESDTSIATDNCSTRVNEALDAIGVSSVNNPMIPGSAGARAEVDGGLTGSATVIDIPKGTTGLPLPEANLIQQFEPKKSSYIPPPGAPGGTPVVTMHMKTKSPEDKE